MMDNLIIIIGGYLSIAVTWIFYLAVMNLSRNKDRLMLVSKCFAYPMLWIGLVADMLFNFFWGSILFLEFPKELLMTTRLKRHLRDHKKDWRDRNANWFCYNFLDPFDPNGKHC